MASGTLGTSLFTAGTQTVTVGDQAHPTIHATSGGVTVNAAAATEFSVTASPNTATAGHATTVTFTALDPYGNTATSYTGPVTLSEHRQPGRIRHAVDHRRGWHRRCHV